MRGFFDQNDGNPKVEIEISGTTSGLTKKIIALFDTGHNGTLSLPIFDLIEIGAKLRGCQPVSYASGYVSVVYLFGVNVIVDGIEKEVYASMIENPTATEAIAGLQLFAPYISLINFKEKTIIFATEEELRRLESSRASRQK
jgi:predicted aspartyl protease